MNTVSRRLISLTLIAFGLVVGLSPLHQLYAHHDMLSWEQAEGQLIRVELVDNAAASKYHNEPMITPVIEYQYDAQRASHIGGFVEGLSDRDFSVQDRQKVQLDINKLGVVGDYVSIYFNPNTTGFKGWTDSIVLPYSFRNLQYRVLFSFLLIVAALLLLGTRALSNAEKK